MSYEDYISLYSGASIPCGLWMFPPSIFNGEHTRDFRNYVQTVTFGGRIFENKSKNTEWSFIRQQRLLLGEQLCEIMMNSVNEKVAHSPARVIPYHVFAFCNTVLRLLHDKLEELAEAEEDPELLWY